MIIYNPLISNKIEQKIPEALSVGPWFKGDIFTPLSCKFLPLEVNLSLVENHRSKVFNGHHSVLYKVDLGIKGTASCYSISLSMAVSLLLAHKIPPVNNYYSDKNCFDWNKMKTIV